MRAGWRAAGGGEGWRRARVQDLFDIDLAQLGRVAALLDAQDEGRRDLKGIHRECCTILYQAGPPARACDAARSPPQLLPANNNLPSRT